MGCGKSVQIVKNIKVLPPKDKCFISTNNISDEKSTFSADSKAGNAAACDYENFCIIERHEDYQYVEAFHVSSQQNRLIKMIPKENLSEKLYFKNKSILQLREAKILKLLSHQNIQKCFEVIEDEINVGIVFEYLNGMSSLNSKFRVYNEFEASQIMKQLFSAVSYMHSKRVIHRKITLNTIFIDENNLSIKLCNFEDAFMKGLEQPSKILEELPFVAPDFESSRYSEKCDEWNCGVIMYMLLTGESPFPGQNEIEIKAKMRSGNYLKNTPKYDAISLQAKYIIDKLLNIDSLARVSAAVAINYPWVQQAMNEGKNKKKQAQQSNNSNLSMSRESEMSQIVPLRRLSCFSCFCENKGDSDFVDFNDFKDNTDETYQDFLKGWLKIVESREGLAPSSYREFCEKEHQKYGEIVISIPKNFD
ncbi:unnamed protein product [Blepharisma stoltei]|uniref:Protein kinase domain-containing protein n=1 Tax=Blepharisma stoltei TaxID=1481888 RepID=A0AAU9K381_9CILI|nr:unnamed protein product [Blepharisma stoltei]